jgi:hypothetical protein
MNVLRAENKLRNSADVVKKKLKIEIALNKMLVVVKRVRNFFLVIIYAIWYVMMVNVKLMINAFKNV